MLKQNFQLKHKFISPLDDSENLSSTIQFSEIPKLNELSFDPDAPPIWELVAKISAQVPDEEWKKLPTDLARRFDYYQKSPSEHHYSTSELESFTPEPKVPTSEHQHPRKKLETSPSELQRCTYKHEVST